MIGNIPPITSTGSRRRRYPAKLEGLAHMSLGRLESERRMPFGVGNASTISWDGKVSRYVAPKPTQKHVTIQYQPKIECISDIIEDYNVNGDLVVILQFTGISFLREAFAKSRNDYGQNTCVYYTPVSYKNKRVYLILSTIGDIVEFEVVPQEKGIEQLFCNEIHIPKLTRYDASSMYVALTNGIIVISYKMINFK